MENGIATIVLGSSTPHHGNTASRLFRFNARSRLDARSSRRRRRCHRRDDDPAFFFFFFFFFHVSSPVSGTRIGTERKRTKTTIEFANLPTIRIRCYGIDS